MAATYFRNRKGQPFQLTIGQTEIFRVIYEPNVLRAAIATYTQYGKSDVTSMALIMAACTRKEKILIVAPSEKQATIIMNDVIDHLFDDADITSMLEFDPASLERLKKERSKNRITFRNGSEIFILTANVTTISKESLTLMGFGATIVVADESSLIPDEMFSKILRMVGGVENGKLIKLGNTFEKNHFFKSLHSPRYIHVTIDYRQGIAEGRISPDFIQEAREDMPPKDFGIFYECKFPEGGADDSVLPLDWIELAVNQQGVGGSKKQVGIDVARFGRDKSIYALRVGGNLITMRENQKIDTMELVGWVRGFMDVDNPETTAIDVVGIGAGVYDRLEELEYQVTGVNAGSSPLGDENKEKYYNLRAQMFWELRNIFKPENGRSMVSIPDDADLIQELSEIRYKFSSEKKIRIEDKEDFKKRIGRSPDKADAVALAFLDLTAMEPELIIY